MTERLEHLVERPVVMPGDFIVTLKLLVLRPHLDVRQIRLLQMSYVVSIRPNHLSSLGMSAVLTHYDWVERCCGSVLQEFVQAALHGDSVAGDDKDRDGRLRSSGHLWLVV